MSVSTDGKGKCRFPCTVLFFFFFNIHTIQFILQYNTIVVLMSLTAYIVTFTPI